MIALLKSLMMNYNEIVESEISGIIGLGYDLPFGLRIDGRYNFGLTDISKSDSWRMRVSKIRYLHLP